MVDKAPVETYMNHLFTLAVNCADIGPELSRFYLNKIQSSVDYTSDNPPHEFSGLLQKFCQHCNTLFNANNCRTRVIPKRSRKKTSKKRHGKVDHEKCCHHKGDKAKTLPRRFNHVSMLCKTCGKKSFYTGLPRTSSIKPNSKSSPNFSNPRIKNTEPNSTSTLSKSAKRRQSRQHLTLKSMLQSDERHKSKSPRLQDFLQTL